MFLEEKHPSDPLPFPDRRQAFRRKEDGKLARRERELEAGRRISQALSQHIALDELIVRALHTSLEVVNAESGSLMLADQETKQLVFRHVIGGDAERLVGKAFPWNEGIAGAVFHSGQSEVLADVKKDPRHFPEIDELTGYRSRDMIALPLKRWEGEPIGVIEILNKREGCLNEDDVAILTIISALAATAIEQARLHEEAKLAEVAKLAGDISHDIKNLLMPVTCGAGILRDEVDDLAKAVSEKNLEQARKSRELCHEVIDMLMEDARRISDRVREVADCVKGLSAPPQFAPCQVANVVQLVFRTLEVLAKEKAVALRSEGLDTLPEFEADERRLYNAFYNLVNNAIPEVPRGGSVTVRGSVDQAAGVVHVAVADTGRGMPPEVRDSLFTARMVSKKAGGTGLGTKIVKDVVDAHKGRITVESEVGKGTTFHLFLPMRQA